MHPAKRIHVPAPFIGSGLRRLWVCWQERRRRRRAVADLLASDDPRLHDLGHCRVNLDSALRSPDLRASLWYTPALAERIYAQRAGTADEAHDRAWRRC